MQILLQTKLKLMVVISFRVLLGSYLSLILYSGLKACEKNY